MMPFSKKKRKNYKTPFFKQSVLIQIFVRKYIFNIFQHEIRIKLYLNQKPPNSLLGRDINL